MKCFFEDRHCQSCPESVCESRYEAHSERKHAESAISQCERSQELARLQQEY